MVAVALETSLPQTEEDEYLVVAGSAFTISRTAFKDNSSHYQVDGKRVSFKEVAALLRAQGVDLDHNRFLILQVCHLACLVSVAVSVSQASPPPPRVRWSR